MLANEGNYHLCSTGLLHLNLGFSLTLLYNLA